MRRLFWTAFGATVGVLVVRRVSQAAEALTPPALAQSLSSSLLVLADAVRDFTEQVREGMAEREAELRADLGLDAAAEPRGRRAALDPLPARLPLPGSSSPTGPDPWTGRHP